LSESIHIPVMVEEVVRYLLENNGTKFLDCTLGAGGHSALLLAKATRPIQIVAIDIDNTAVDVARRKFKDVKNIQIEQGDYGNLSRLSKQIDISGLDGIIADFGQSSDQLLSDEVGMSYQHNTALDMRYDRSRGMSAKEYLNSVNFDDLKSALKEIGQEDNAAKIASAIIKAKPLETTDDLSKAVRSVTSSFKWNKALSRVFMVVRCVVNDELGAIDRFLVDAPKLMKSGGRILCISFDSNQDSRVKNSFRSLANPCNCPPALPVCVCNRKPTMKVITSRALKPSDSEIDMNKRSRSARLRIAEKI